MLSALPLALALVLALLLKLSSTSLGRRTMLP
jgi:hypothetical protein